MDDTLGILTGSKIFSKLDLKSEHWQVDMIPEDREKTYNGNKYIVVVVEFQQVGESIHNNQ